MAHFTHGTDEVVGPRLQVIVTPSEPRRRALEEAGEEIPDPAWVQALVDTGASCTCVDPAILKRLNLNPTGSVPVHTPSTAGKAEEFDQYDVGLAIPGSDTKHAPLHLDPISVVASEKLSQQGGHAVLIGRDILSDCIVVYNGPAGFFTLAF